jgi:hypothetical protein
MATNIFKFDGTLLTTVADGTIDTTHSTLRFPGSGYKNYGQPVMENLLWTMTHFAGAAQPLLPLTGQAWYDVNTNVLKIYNGITWQAAGGVQISAIRPTIGSSAGAFWFDSNNLQLYTWNGAAWNLIGPLGSAINEDAVSNSIVPTNSAWESVRIYDGANYHQVWRLTIGGTVIAIISKDSQFTPDPVNPITGFANISPGINFNSTITGTGITGNDTTFRSNKDSVPDTNGTRSLGSSTNYFSSVYGNNGVFKTAVSVNGTVGSYALQVNGTSFLNGTTSLIAGTTTSPPLKLQSGVLLTNPQLGALEFDGTSIYVTLNNNGTPTRSVIAAGTSGGNVAAVPNTLTLRDGNASITANVFYGVATSARYADVAERYAVDVAVTPGDVVILGGKLEITITDTIADPNVFGVISTNPGVRMNDDAGTNDTHPLVAMLGRVPCKVKGQVNKGQRLITSDTPGTAIGETVSTGSAFARSLVDKTSEEPELIEVVLLGIR